MSLYIGVNGTPKKVKKLFVGVNGSPKEVKTGYTGGVNSSVNKVYSSFNLEEELNKVNPVAALTSGQITSAHIGRTVYLSNSKTQCQEWVIADINHDSTSGTVDLFSKYTLHNSITPGSQYYNTSFLNTYLEYTVYNGFAAEVKNALNNMNVASIGEIIQRHVVAPSMKELCILTPSSDCADEGSMYPIFSPLCQTTNPKSIFKNTDGSDARYWTRSKCTSGTDYIWCVDSLGSGYAQYYPGANMSVVARIRFAKS